MIPYKYMDAFNVHIKFQNGYVYAWLQKGIQADHISQDNMGNTWNPMGISLSKLTSYFGKTRFAL